MWNKFFVKDNFGFGILMGALLPLVFLGVLYLIYKTFYLIAGVNILAEESYLYLLSIAANLFAIKYYFVNLKYDKTGRGILVMTFLFGLAYFVIFN
jgi:hypothetical protein